MAWTWLARTGLVGLLLTAPVLGGCGDGGGGGGAPASYAGQSEALTVKPDEAAELALGAVKVAFPAGAVDQEVDVTLKIRAKEGQPDETNIALDVYEFGPSMQFKLPVELSFDLAGVKVPSNKRAVVAVLDEAEQRWKKLSDSTVSNGKVKGSTTHFSMFTVIFELSSSGGQVGGQCSENFDACGGDLVGTWTFAASCVSAPLSAIIGEDNPLLSCAEPPVAMFGIELEGSVTFRDDGTMSVTQSSLIKSDVTIPASCLTEQGAGSGLSTEELCERAGGTLGADGCVLATENNDSVNESGTYEVADGKLYTETESAEENTAEEEQGSDAVIAPARILKQAEDDGVSYCVKGNTVSVRNTSLDGFVMEYTATRQ